MPGYAAPPPHPSGAAAPPIPARYRQVIQSIGALAYLTEERIASLYADLGKPYGDSPAALYEFKRNLGMTRAQIDNHYYDEESTDANP